METFNLRAFVFAILAGKESSATKKLAIFLALTVANAQATENAFVREDFLASFAICLQMIFAAVTSRKPF